MSETLRISAKSRNRGESNCHFQRRLTMNKLRIMSVAAAIIFGFGVTTIDCAFAGEKRKIKAHGANYTVKLEQVEVGDEEGHIIAFSQSKGVYFDEITGEKLVDSDVAIVDINLKTGVGRNYGYGVLTNEDGDKMFRKWEGKPAARGQWKGVWTIIRCTGKHEGCKGGGTWTAYSLAPRQEFVEVEGEMETPAK
jgi:hypothetical protein